MTKHIRNLFIVWFLTGMWHGASWTFIAWGLYYGVILALEKYVFKDILEKLWEPLKHVYTLVLVIIGWVIFKAESFGKAFNLIKTMFFLNNKKLMDNQGVFFLREYKIELIIAIIATIPIYEFIEKNIMNIRIRRKVIRKFIMDYLY